VSEENNNERKHNKIIDVTKSQKKKAPETSNIDASRVSAYTLREQQALEKLKKQVGNLDQRENRAAGIKTIIAIILVVILIILAVVFVLIIGKNSPTNEVIYDMRLSMQIENKSTLSIITETGQEQLREINPGDKVPLRATVRNSEDIRGDIVEEGTNPPAIFVRFKLVLILDYQERYDIMIPTMSNRWYKYDAYTENKVVNGVGADDHYYYYLGSLNYMEPQVLFSEIEFDGDVITCEDGGKYGQIQVHVECIEADTSTIVSRKLWPTAPQGWVIKMLKGETTTENPVV